MKYSELNAIRQELAKKGIHTKIKASNKNYGELALFDISYNFPIELNITKKEGV